MAKEWWEEYELKKGAPPSAESGTAPKEWWEDYELNKKPKLPQEKGGLFSDPWNSDLVRGLTFRGDKESLDRQGAGFVQSMVKGVPIVGNITKLAPQEVQQHQDQYKEEHPVLNALGNVAGGAMSTAPLSAGVAGLTAKAMGPASGLNAVAPGARFLPQAATQAGLFGALGAGDEIANKGTNVTADDILKSGGIGAASGVTGAGLARLLSPAGPLTGAQKYHEADKSAMAVLDSMKGTSQWTPALARVEKNLIDAKGMVPHGREPGMLSRAASSIGENFNSSILNGLLGGAIGTHFGSPIEGMVAGALTPYARPAISGWAHNHSMYKPAVEYGMNTLSKKAIPTGADYFSKEALLNALMYGSANKAADVLGAGEAVD